MVWSGPWRVVLKWLPIPILLRLIRRLRSSASSTKNYHITPTVVRELAVVGEAAVGAVAAKLHGLLGLSLPLNRYLLAPTSMLASFELSGCFDCFQIHPSFFLEFGHTDIEYPTGPLMFELYVTETIKTFQRLLNKALR